MSWSVSTEGKPAEVVTELTRQFSYPLAEGLAGLYDAGEKETVKLCSDMIMQCLGTFDPTKSVRVSAYGHMGVDDWELKTGKVQTVHIAIEPTGK